MHARDRSFPALIRFKRARVVSAYAQLGFEDGDVLRAVNGLPLRSKDEAQAAHAWLATANVPRFDKIALFMVRNRPRIGFVSGGGGSMSGRGAILSTYPCTGTSSPRTISWRTERWEVGTERIAGDAARERAGIARPALGDVNGHDAQKLPGEPLVLSSCEQGLGEPGAVAVAGAKNPDVDPGGILFAAHA